MRKEDLPPTFLRVWAALDVPFTLGFLGLGVFYVARGNAGGDVIGAIFIAAATWRLWAIGCTIAGR